MGAPLDDADHRGLLESLVWFGADYGPGDPLPLDPVAVEIILDDWIPRKIVADPAYLSKAPGLLRAFVRFCHAERGIRTELTADTLAAVDVYEPDYQRTIRSPRPQGPMALLAAMGAIDPDGPWPMGELDDDSRFDFGDHGGLMRRLLVDGCRRRRRAAHPRRPAVPDEEFDWSRIAGDIHGKVGEVLALTDACCDELLDVEYRTACRRLLARAAAGDAAVFRRRASSASAAAAICWIVGKDNDLFSHRGGGMQVKDLIAHFGLKQGSVSQRAETLMKAAGIDPSTPSWDLRLGAPQLLVSRRRRRMIELRNEYANDD